MLSARRVLYCTTAPELATKRILAVTFSGSLNGPIRVFYRGTLMSGNDKKHDINKHRKNERHINNSNTNVNARHAVLARMTHAISHIFGIGVVARPTRITIPFLSVTAIRRNILSNINNETETRSI